MEDSSKLQQVAVSEKLTKNSAATSSVDDSVRQMTKATGISSRFLGDLAKQTEVIGGSDTFRRIREATSTSNSILSDIAKQTEAFGASSALRQVIEGTGISSAFLSDSAQTIMDGFHELVSRHSPSQVRQKNSQAPELMEMISELVEIGRQQLNQSSINSKDGAIAARKSNQLNLTAICSG